MPQPHDLSTTDDVHAALEQPRAILFKYGTRCPISTSARGQLAAFCADCADALVYEVAVDRQPEVSEYIAERLGVAHASPQAIVLEGGAIRWSGTHHGITARLLAERWAATGPAEAGGR